MKESHDNEIRSLKEEITKLRISIDNKNLKGHTNITNSYANAVKIKDTKKDAVVIKSKKDTDKMGIEDIRKTLDVTELPMGINRVKNKDAGSIIVNYETNKENNNIESIIKASLGEEFIIKNLSKTNPKLKIVGLNNEEMNMASNDLIKAIKNQNYLNGKTQKFAFQIVFVWYSGYHS